MRELQVNWRRNGKKLSRRKAIREEASRRIQANRNDDNAHQVRDWAHQKIRRFYDVVPLCDVWPIRRAVETMARMRARRKAEAQAAIPSLEDLI